MQMVDKILFFVDKMNVDIDNQIDRYSDFRLHPVDKKKKGRRLIFCPYGRFFR
jgi:hypothetical protein